MKPAAMASARVVQIIVILTLCLGLQAKVYTRCQLTRELLKNNFSRTFLSNWVCLIEQESERNTSALVVKTARRKYYGLFQIGSEWCKEGKKGGKCDITCESLLDEDIKDDGICATKVFEQEGFKYWAKWEARCKGQSLPDIEKFCIALEEMDGSDVPLSLVLGCGAPLQVRQRATFATVLPIVVTRAPEINPLRVSEVRSNVTSEGVLTVLISVMGLPQRPQYVLPRSQRLSNDVRPINNCYIILAVLSRGSLVAQKDTPCQSTLEISMEGFVRGPYEVCAAISKYKIDETRTICVVPQLIEALGTLEMKAGFKGLNTALIGVALGLMVIVIGLVWFVRKMLKKPAEFEPHRCFRQEPVQEENPRASYVMLTATSKV